MLDIIKAAAIKRAERRLELAALKRKRRSAFKKLENHPNYHSRYNPEIGKIKSRIELDLDFQPMFETCDICTLPLHQCTCDISVFTTPTH